MHSLKERRYLCSRCGRTFAATRGTPLFRLQSPAELVLVVLSLLSWGCPVQAVVHTFLLVTCQAIPPAMFKEFPIAGGGEQLVRC